MKTKQRVSIVRSTATRARVMPVAYLAELHCTSEADERTNAGLGMDTESRAKRLAREKDRSVLVLVVHVVQRSAVGHQGGRCASSTARHGLAAAQSGQNQQPEEIRHRVLLC